MGEDRHYYDRHGNYRGSSSNKGPIEKMLQIILGLFILFVFFRGCS